MREKNKEIPKYAVLTQIHTQCFDKKGILPTLRQDRQDSSHSQEPFMEHVFVAAVSHLKS